MTRGTQKALLIGGGAVALAGEGWFIYSSYKKPTVHTGGIKGVGMSAPLRFRESNSPTTEVFVDEKGRPILRKTRTT